MDLTMLLIVVAIVAGAIGVAIGLMAVGVIFSDRRIRGSCGGLSTMQGADGKPACMACGGSPADCDDGTRRNRDDRHEARSARDSAVEHADG